jgi:NodT family efflux transporter outer membrane factor (OMF) lipoprotein
LPFFLPRLRAWRTAVLAAVPLVFLAGCADMGGIAPQSQLKTTAEVLQEPLAREAVPDTGAWWESWDDAQLNRLMAQALAGNPTLRVARSRIELAAAAADEAESLTSLRADAKADFRRERFSETHVFPPPLGGTVYWNNEAALSLAYDLDLWGRQDSLAAAALDEHHAALAEAWQVRQALAAAVAEAYAQWARQLTLLDLAREERQRLAKGLALIQRRQQAGLAAGREGDTLADALARQQAKEEALAATVALARHQLAALAGLAPGAADGLETPHLAAAETLALPTHLPADLVGRRPDLIAQRWRVEAAGERIHAAKAAFYPNIDLMAFAGFQALGFTRLLDGASGVHGFGPALSLPLFDGGRRRSRLGQETAAYDGAVEAYNGLLVKSLQAVADRVTELDANQRETRAAEQSRSAARRRLDSTLRAWQAGVLAYSAVLEAQGAELSARENLASLAAARRRGYAGLMLALGGGLPNELEMPGISSVPGEKRSGSDGGPGSPGSARTGSVEEGVAIAAPVARAVATAGSAEAQP